MTLSTLLSGAAPRRSARELVQGRGQLQPRAPATTRASTSSRRRALRSDLRGRARRARAHPAARASTRRGSTSAGASSRTSGWPRSSCVARRGVTHARSRRPADRRARALPRVRLRAADGGAGGAGQRRRGAADVRDACVRASATSSAPSRRRSCARPTSGCSSAPTRRAGRCPPALARPPSAASSAASRRSRLLRDRLAAAGGGSCSWPGSRDRQDEPRRRLRRARRTSAATLSSCTAGPGRSQAGSRSAGRAGARAPPTAVRALRRRMAMHVRTARGPARGGGAACRRVIRDAPSARGCRMPRACSRPRCS